MTVTYPRGKSAVHWRLPDGDWGRVALTTEPLSLSNRRSVTKRFHEAAGGQPHAQVRGGAFATDFSVPK